MDGVTDAAGCARSPLARRTARGGTRTPRPSRRTGFGRPSCRRCAGRGGPPSWRRCRGSRRSPCWSFRRQARAGPRARGPSGPRAGRVAVSRRGVRPRRARRRPPPGTDGPRARHAAARPRPRQRRARVGAGAALASPGRSRRRRGCAPDRSQLTALERELLDLLSMAGENTTPLEERMLTKSPGRDAVERALSGLAERGLVVHSRGTYIGEPRSFDGVTAYEDDWWDLTPAGRQAIGLPPRRVDRARTA